MSSCSLSISTKANFETFLLLNNFAPSHMLPQTSPPFPCTKLPVDFLIFAPLIRYLMTRNWVAHAHYCILWRVGRKHLFRICSLTFSIFIKAYLYNGKAKQGSISLKKRHVVFTLLNEILPAKIQKRSL